jgi:hypothetical protein
MHNCLDGACFCIGNKTSSKLAVSCPTEWRISAHCVHVRHGPRGPMNLTRAVIAARAQPFLNDHFLVCILPFGGPNDGHARGRGVTALTSGREAGAVACMSSVHVIFGGGREFNYHRRKDNWSTVSAEIWHQCYFLKHCARLVSC